MLLETFRGPDLAALFRQARSELGEDVLMLRTRVRDGVRRREYEVVTTTPREVSRLRSSMRSRPLTSVQQHRASGRPPFVVALVGPPAADHADTLAMLASDVNAFAEWNVGVLAPTREPARTLQSLASVDALRDLPVEVVSQGAELQTALQSLADCDVILVYALNAETGTQYGALVHAALQALSPDETHVVLPYDIEPSEARSIMARYVAGKPSHLMLSGCDADDGESELVHLVSAAALPVRWLVHRSEKGVALQSAAARIIGGLQQKMASAAGAGAW